MDPIDSVSPPTDEEILQAQSSESDPQVAAAPAESAFNPQEFGYKFRNDTVFPKDRDEAIELMQLGHSFRTNKPKWEQERQTLATYEARKQDYQRYDQLSQALQANPEFRSELEKLAEKFNGTKPPAQPNQPPASVPPEFMEKVNQLAQWKEQQETREADNDLKRELDGLEAANSQYDWKTDAGEGDLRKQLLAYMHTNSVYNPEIALSAMMHKSDLQRARFEAEKKAADETAKARKAGVVAPGTQPAPQAPAGGVNHKAMSYDDLENAALASLGR
jgi:hypothetical protein